MSIKAESVVSSSSADKVMSSSSSSLLSKKKGKHTTQSSRATKSTWTTFVFTMLRCILLDIPLTIIFFGYMLLFAIQTVHDVYYIPLMDRSTRTDSDLHSEFTYYHRHCTERDLTTRNMNDLLAINNGNNGGGGANATTSTEIVSATVAQLMQHGAVVIPQILSPDTVRDLREYAVYRNKVLKEEEEYPMSQGDGGTRRSFGYDATEHPALVQALKQVTHNEHLKRTLAAVLGDDDPASSEITTITAYYGAIPQEWHSDTKEDGNALKFARTYSHSYSLFLPLQNITAAMGATDVCPGTHYCANDLGSMCQDTSMGLHESTPEGVFRAGDGALLNQHVWHRGGPHSDPDSLERIVFIVSFLARPKFRADTRQLSRGTYFHQKWNMWGHTWKDLTDPMRSMQYPFSLLRCLSLWKPPTHNWGYDLITSGFMRFSNEQMDLMDISDRLVPRFDDFHYPEWLRGPVLWTADDYRSNRKLAKPARKKMPTQKEALKAFIGGTISKTHDFLRKTALLTHAVYAALLLIVTLIWTMLRGKHQGRAVLGRAVFRLTITHSIVASFIFLALYKIKTSDWGHNVIMGKALMRPFPPVRIASSEEMQFISNGPTTYPGTFDVLLGTRFDVKWLGSYEQWLDYHPGNRVYLQHVMQKAPLVALYQHGRRLDGRGSTLLPIVFAQRLLQETIEAVTDKRGRFLQQDYRTGDWLVMTNDEIESSVALEMAWKRTPLHAALEKVLNRWIAFYRFGVWRDSALARKSPVHLHHLKKILVGMNPSPPTTVPLTSSLKPVTTAPLATADESIFVRTRLTIARDKKDDVIAYDEKHVPSHIRFALPSKSAPSNETGTLFRVGDTVVAELADVEGYLWWNRGHIIEFKTGGKCVLSLEDGRRLNNVSLSKVRLWEPIQEGDRVEGCFSDYYEDCFPGTVTRVMPDESVRIVYDDGDIGHRVPPSEYYRPPYKPLPPY